MSFFTLATLALAALCVVSLALTIRSLGAIPPLGGRYGVARFMAVFAVAASVLWYVYIALGSAGALAGFGLPDWANYAIPVLSSVSIALTLTWAARPERGR